MVEQGQGFDDKHQHKILGFHSGQCNIWVKVCIEKKHRAKPEHELQNHFFHPQIEQKDT